MLHFILFILRCVSIPKAETEIGAIEKRTALVVFIPQAHKRRRGHEYGDGLWFWSYFFSTWISRSQSSTSTKHWIFQYTHINHVWSQVLLHNGHAQCTLHNHRHRVDQQTLRWSKHHAYQSRSIWLAIAYVQCTNWSWSALSPSAIQIECNFAIANQFCVLKHWMVR